MRWNAIPATDFPGMAFLPASKRNEHKAAARVLKELLDHHIKEEESSVWNDAKNHFSDDERKPMNVFYLAAKARVRVS